MAIQQKKLGIPEPIELKDKPKNWRGHIYTIGYGGLKSHEELEAIMKQHGISLLIDIRSKPHSRRWSKDAPSWDKKDLQARFGARYVHYPDMGGLGFDSGETEYLRWCRIAEIDIKRIEEIISSDTRVILMCAEKDPNRCHRKSFAGAAFESKGYQVIHL